MNQSCHTGPDLPLGLCFPLRGGMIRATKGKDGDPNMPFNIPVRHNAKLAQLVERINTDQELLQLWKCSNINAIDRSGINDHGEIHIRIVANAALKMLRVLVESGISPSIVKNYGMTAEDAELVVGDAQDHDLAWYAPQELPFLVELL